ncbi:MAG: hypothetical protein RI554_05730 [Trueperaceae bacterium]|nr:hypothetical protein [Trueperaceae bacterium]
MDLVSVHVPKAAGNAVRRLLVPPFGGGVAYLYGDYRAEGAFADRWPALRARDARGALAAVHGHVPLDALRTAFPDAATMVWLRDPVDRVASYAAYWAGRRRHGNPTHDAFLDAGADPVALAEMLQGEVAGYLGATGIEDVDFVGFTETFEADAARFETWLARRGLPSRAWRRPVDRVARASLRAEIALAPVANRTPRRTPLDPAVRAQLEAVLAGERAIYDAARARRARAA